jgi:hypothetical protein
MLRLNDEDRRAWERQRTAAGYPRWSRCCDGAGFVLYVRRDEWREDIFQRRDGLWKVREAVFERLADAMRYGEAAYHRDRAAELESEAIEKGLCY